MRDDLYAPASGLHPEMRIPSKVRRRSLSRPAYKRKLCRDDRNYVFIPFTITGAVATGDYGPMWRVDRNYWIARIMANVGKHASGTHPVDGTPSGAALILNMRRVTANLATDSSILASDTRLKIAIDNHQDVVNDAEEGAAVEGDFNILRLDIGEHIYPRVSQVGSGRPGANLVVTAVLVPIP